MHALKPIFICMFLLITPTILRTDYEESNWLIQYIDENPWSTYNYASNISAISLNRSLSRYSFRAGGSIGEYQVYLYLKKLLESWSLETKVDEFNFIEWSIYDEPNITITIENETETTRIYPVHYTFGTPDEGLIANITYLPLPSKFSYDPLPENLTLIWNTTNISNKILLIGREVLFNADWSDKFFSKIAEERPLAVLYMWATDEFKNFPMFFSSTGGRRYPLYRVYKLPVAWIPKNLIAKILNALEQNKTVIGRIRIPIKESSGIVRNLMATLSGKDASKMLLITAHYDSVMTPALSDNAAGVAGVLELAWAFSRAVREEKYVPPINITFAFFTCEEAGLIGSAKFIEMHKKQVRDSLVGVINLDTLGSYKLQVSIARMSLRYLWREVYIHDVVTKIAKSMGVEIETFEDVIHSDDSTFSAPTSVYELISTWWPDFELNFSDVVPRPAVMVGSWPYLPWQRDSEGRVGWIHTPYDNVTSTVMYDWVDPNRLELQVKVIGLSVLEILEYYEEESSNKLIELELLLGLSACIIIAVIIIIMISRREKSKLI